MADTHLFKPASEEDIRERPNGPAIETIFSVRGVLKELEKKGVTLGYTGLMYYRDLGLIPPPIKGKGTKERFYDVFELQERIMAIKLISSIFSLNYQEIASYANRLPFATFNKLPLGFMKVYVDVQAEINEIIAEGKVVNPSGLFDMWGYEEIKIAFLKAVNDTIEKAQDKSAEEYYLGMVKQNIKDGKLFKALRQ